MRRTNVLRDVKNKKFTANRKFNIPDLAKEKREAERVVEEEEMNRDRTWEEFLNMYQDHIQGKIDPSTRTANRRDKEEKPDEPIEDDEAVVETVNRGKVDTDINLYKYDEKKEAQKKVIGDDCKIQFLSLNMIEDLGEEYMLVHHPFPQIEGELLLYQKNLKDDSADEDILIYRDYSLNKRLVTNVQIANTAALKLKIEEENVRYTKLQSLEIDNEIPLSQCDWGKIGTLIYEIKAMVWVQALPAGMKSSQPFQFNCIHVLPNVNIPYPKIPLDVMIANRAKYLKKREKHLKLNSNLS